MPVLSQLTASAAITMRARLPSSITVSLERVAVRIVVLQGVQEASAVPLSLNWNIDPNEVSVFRVVARFQNPEKALTNPDSSMTIATAALEARWTGDEYLPFSSDGIVTLFRKIVTAESRQGTKQRLLQLNLSDKALSSLPDGSYRGVLLIEIRHY